VLPTDTMEPIQAVLLRLLQDDNENGGHQRDDVHPS
jgi:hypothetical protein